MRYTKEQDDFLRTETSRLGTKWKKILANYCKRFNVVPDGISISALRNRLQRMLKGDKKRCDDSYSGNRCKRCGQFIIGHSCVVLQKDRKHNNKKQKQKLGRRDELLLEKHDEQLEPDPDPDPEQQEFEKGFERDVTEETEEDAEVPDAEAPDSEVPDSEVSDAEVPDAEVSDAEAPESPESPKAEIDESDKKSDDVVDLHVDLQGADEEMVSLPCVFNASTLTPYTDFDFEDTGYLSMTTDEVVSSIN